MTRNTMYEITKMKMSELCEQMKYAYEDEFPDVDGMPEFYGDRIDAMMELAFALDIGIFYFNVSRIENSRAVQVTLHYRDDSEQGSEFEVVFRTSDNMDYKENL